MASTVEYDGLTLEYGELVKTQMKARIVISRD